MQRPSHFQTRLDVVLSFLRRRMFVEFLAQNGTKEGRKERDKPILVVEFLAQNGSKSSSSREGYCCVSVLRWNVNIVFEYTVYSIQYTVYTVLVYKCLSIYMIQYTVTTSYKHFN